MHFSMSEQVYWLWLTENCLRAGRWHGSIRRKGVWCGHMDVMGMIS